MERKYEYVKRVEWNGTYSTVIPTIGGFLEAAAASLLIRNLIMFKEPAVGEEIILGL